MRDLDVNTWLIDKRPRVINAIGPAALRRLKSLLHRVVFMLESVVWLFVVQRHSKDLA